MVSLRQSPTPVVQLQGTGGSGFIPVWGTGPRGPQGPPGSGGGGGGNVLVLGRDEPVPSGTPDGTVIVRTADGAAPGQGSGTGDIVTSVAGRTGAVVLAAADLTDATDLGKQLVTAATAGEAQSALAVPPATRQVATGPGLTGGGNLSVDRTIAVQFGTAAGTVAEGSDTRITGALQRTGGALTGDVTMLGGAKFVGGKTDDTYGVAVSIVRNGVEVGTIDNNGNALRAWSKTNPLQLRGPGNNGITVNANGDAIVAGAVTSAGKAVVLTDDARLPSQAFAEAVMDVVATYLVAGAGISVTNNDANNTLTIATA